MLVTRDMTDDMQPDTAIEFVARVCSGVRDIAGASLQWWWLGDGAVRLLCEVPGSPSVTIDVREVEVGTCRSPSGSILAAGDLIDILLGRRGKPKARVAA